MATQTKEYLIKTVYDNAGMAKFAKDAETARLEAQKLGVEMSKTAAVIQQNVSTSFNAAGQSVRTVTSVMEQHGKSAKVTFTEVDGAVKKSSASWLQHKNVVSEAAGEWGKLVSRAILVVPVWEAIRAGLHLITGTFKESISFMIEWEDEMAKIRAISNGSTAAMKDISAGLLDISTSLGINSKDLAEGATEWIRHGTALKEIVPLMDATARFSLITGRSVSDSVKALDTVMAGYKLTADETATVVDKLTAVQSKMGVSAGEIGDALRKVSSTAANAGVGFDQLVGMITAVQQVTKATGEQVGTVLRSVFLRLGTTAIDTAQSIAKVPFYLDETGRATMEHTGELRDMSAVLTELALKYQQLGTAQRDQLVKAVGGNLRANQVAALFQNFDAVVAAQAESAFGLKDADKAIAELTGSAKSKLQQLHSSWNELVESFSNTDWIKGSIDALKNLNETLAFTFDPERFKTETIVSKFGEASKEASRQFQQNFNLINLIDTLKQMNDIFSKQIPGSIEKSVLYAQIFQTKFKEAGIDLGATFKDTFDLQKILEGQKPELLQQAINAQITIRKDEILKQLVENNHALLSAINEATSGGLKVGFNAELGEVMKKLQNNIRLTDADFETLAVVVGKTLSPEKAQAFNALMSRIQGTAKDLADTEASRADIADKMFEKKKRETEQALTDEQVKNKIQEIELEGIRTQEDKLVIIQKQLDFIRQANAANDKGIDTEVDSLEKKKAQLEASRELLLINLKENEVLEQMKINGASSLQIAVQQAAFLKAQPHPDQEKLAKAQAQVQIESLKEEKALRDQLISTITDSLKAQGATESESIKTKMSLEDQLGIHKQGIDLLKEQLDLYQAITKENQKTREERQKDLSDLIKKTPANTFSSAFRENALDTRDESLRRAARNRGISEEKINSILNPATLPSGNVDTASAIKDLQRVLGGGAPTVQSLSTLISDLSSTIQRPETVPIGNNAKLTGNEQTGLLTEEQRNRIRFENGTSGVHSTTVIIDGINVTVQGRTPEEIAKGISEITSDIIAAKLVQPNSKVNRAAQQTIEEF